jgi:hypothetical protein
MKTIYVRFLSAFFGLAAFAAAARAQEIDQIIVKVPYEFVASGKTLPAGTYRVQRAYDDRGFKVLVMTSFENREGVLLLSSDVSTAREYKPAVSFEYVGDQYFLSKIETADHIFTYPVSKSATQVVAMKKQTSPAASSSSGSN